MESLSLSARASRSWNLKLPTGYGLHEILVRDGYMQTTHNSFFVWCFPLAASRRACRLITQQHDRHASARVAADDRRAVAERDASEGVELGNRLCRSRPSADSPSRFIGIDCSCCEFTLVHVTCTHERILQTHHCQGRADFTAARSFNLAPTTLFDQRR